MQNQNTSTRYVYLSTEKRRGGSKALEGSLSLPKEDLGKTGDLCIKISQLVQNYSSVDYADAQIYPHICGIYFATQADGRLCDTR